MEQDNLEDYVKLSQNKEYPRRDEARVRNIITTVQKKKECEDKAIRIVELLMEGTVKSEIFLKSIAYLNTSYYQDIVEERAIIRTCGYPLCGKKIQPVPKKRYSISTKNNKVYDLNECGYFCSMYCYNASNHIKKQIDNSPLWLREYEEIPVFNLLPKDKGNTGDGIDLRIKEKVVSENFTPISSFAEISLDEFINFEAKKTDNDDRKQFKLPTVVEDKEESDEVKQKFVSKKPKKLSKCKLETVAEDSKEDPKIEDNSVQNEKTQEESNSLRKERKFSKELKILNDKIRTKIPKSTIKLIDPIPLKNEEKLSNDDGKSKEKLNISLKFSLKNPEEVENQIRKAFKQWITLDTLIFIHGENKVKEILNEKKLIECFDELKITQLEISQQKKYIDICKRLQMQDILENEIDNKCKGIDKLRPIPDFNELKRETKELDIKVKTFYSGLHYETEDSNFPEKEKTEEGIPPVLPLADAYSQNALRRRVLFNSLNKGMKFFLDLINYKSELPSQNLLELIKTFTLNAENVVFKPIMWNYLGFICLKVLSLKDNELKGRIGMKNAVEFENIMFELFPGKTWVTLEILKLIENIETFMSNTLTQEK